MKRILLLFLFLPLISWSQTSFENAEKLFKEERYDKAQPILESVIKTSPNNLKAIEYLGDIAGKNKSWDEAIQYYSKLKHLRPSEANYHFKYGGVLGMKALHGNRFKALGMIDEVKSSFEKAITLNPKHIEARWALIEMYMQLPGIVGGSQTKAIKYSNELMRISTVDGYLSRGHIEEYFKRYSAAEAQFKKAIAISGSKASYQRLANLYKNKMNEPEKAKATLEEFRNRK